VTPRRQALFCVSLGSFLALVSSSGDLHGQTFQRWHTPCDGQDLTAGVALGDLDGDGDLDVVFVNGRHEAQTDWVFSNDGSGRLYGKRALGTPDPSYAVALADLNGDGSLDVVVANDVGARSVTYRNDGRGHFSVWNALGNYLLPQPRRALAIGDLDGDGDPDVVLVGLGQDHIYLNEDAGSRWTERPLGSRGAGRATGVVIADLDADGDLDIVVPGRYEAPNVVHLNDGKAGFAATRTFGVATDDVTTVAVGDIDGDGDLDIVAGHWEQPHTIHLNDGRGHFVQAGTFGTGREWTWTVVLGDMDLDGDLDAVVGNVDIGFSGGVRTDRNEPSRVYMNHGFGQFLPGSPISTGNDNTRPLALGDLDGDGDLDVVMGNDCQPNHVFYNAVREPKPK
jgi:hypothetical protein